MAIKEVKLYYYTMLNQYLEGKNDLADLEEACKAGHITEDQLESIKQDLKISKDNLDRIQYILYLFSLPNKKSKRAIFERQNASLKAYFNDLGVTEEDLKDENKDALDHLKLEVKKLKQGVKNGNNN